MKLLRFNHPSCQLLHVWPIQKEHIVVQYSLDLWDPRPPMNKPLCTRNSLFLELGGGPRVVVSTAAFHARVRGSVPGLGGFKETKMFLPHPRVKVSIVGSLRDREVACSASDRQGSNFESCVWRTVSSQSSHHPQEVLLAQFSLYVHKGGLKPDSFHFIYFLELFLERLLFQFALVTNDHEIKSVPRLYIPHPPVQQNMLCIIMEFKHEAFIKCCLILAVRLRRWPKK